MAPPGRAAMHAAPATRPARRSAPGGRSGRCRRPRPSRGHLEHPQVAVGVAAGQVLPVGRPFGCVEEGGGGEFDLPPVLAALAGDDQPVLARVVREPGHLAPIGRPDRGAVRGVDAAAEVPRVTLLHRYGRARSSGSRRSIDSVERNPDEKVSPPSLRPPEAGGYEAALTEFRELTAECEPGSRCDLCLGTCLLKEEG